MQQQLLELYQKAQSGSLDAQEVMWLETQARENPWSSMPHTILSRHHAVSKTTIKDRVLLRGAGFALNRARLKGYVMDGLGNGQAASAASVETVAPAIDLEKVEEDSGIRNQESGIKNLESGNEEQEPEEESGITNQESGNEEAVLDAAREVPESEATAATPVVQPPKINWFLNTRLNIRGKKYAGLTEKLQAQVESHAGAISTKPNDTEVAEAPVAETPTADAPATEVEATAETPAAEKEAPATPRTQRKRRSTSKPSVRSEAKKEESAASSTGYEIGSFSSFTFLDESVPEESDGAEIDTPITTAEAVALNQSDEGVSEIVFEENDRIVEIEVTPEQIARYFGGELPSTHNIDTSLEFDAEAMGAEKKTAPQSETPTETVIEIPAEDPPAIEVETAHSEAESEVSEGEREAILERFMETEPSISRMSDYEARAGDLAKTSGIEDENLVTETLAQIHALQGNKKKARQIYEKLALIFPEKSSYFADQISKLNAQ